MQIYGDSAREIDIAEFAREVLRQSPAPHCFASQRAFLIACGQLEQLVWDAPGASQSLRAESLRATDHAAAAFYSSWSPAHAQAPPVDWRAEDEIERAQTSVARVASHGSARGSIKVPEGFAFYALYPEQYCASAVRYLSRHHSHVGMAHVFGLRSIGTTLSAVVAIVLKAARFEHCRYTVRPCGHPFRRELELPRAFGPEDSALVVDEGPGLSGSSFFAAACALDSARVPAQRCAYFCAHDRVPGTMASAEIQGFWRDAERYAAAAEEPRVGREGTLGAALSAGLSRNFAGNCSRLRDVSGGSWRRFAFAHEDEWPAAYRQFERPKYLAEFADGRRVLLKFYGQVLRADAAGCWQSADRAAASSIGASGSQVVTIHGYVARRWIDGRPLSRADKRTHQCERLAAFLVRRTSMRARGAQGAPGTYVGCSGRMAPEEWLRLASG
ncbi:MAG TPA: hypothetical protein VHV51_18490, partial [Polyangiaceae bacterium]|nr:hypothetical protein [Polyangiaceae bacterium]